MRKLNTLRFCLAIHKPLSAFPVPPFCLALVEAFGTDLAGVAFLSSKEGHRVWAVT